MGWELLSIDWPLEQFALPSAREECVSSIKMVFATRQNLYTNSKDTLLRIRLNPYWARIRKSRIREQLDLSTQEYSGWSHVKKLAPWQRTLYQVLDAADTRMYEKEVPAGNDGFAQAVRLHSRRQELLFLQEIETADTRLRDRGETAQDRPSQDPEAPCVSIFAGSEFSLTGNQQRLPTPALQPGTQQHVGHTLLSLVTQKHSS